MSPCVPLFLRVPLCLVEIQNVNNPFLLVNVYACCAKFDAQGWQVLHLDFRRMLFSAFILMPKADYGATPVPTSQVSKWRTHWSPVTAMRINDARVTTIASGTSSEEILIDSAVLSPLFALICRWEVLENYDSDHYPCTIHVEGRERGQQNTTITSLAIFEMSMAF